MKISNKKLLKQLSQRNETKARGADTYKDRAKRVIALLLVAMFMFASLSPAMDILGFASADDAIEAEVLMEEPALEDDPVTNQEDDDTDDEKDTDIETDVSDDDDIIDDDDNDDMIDDDDNDDMIDDDDNDDIIGDDDNDDIIDDDDNMESGIMGTQFGIGLLSGPLSADTFRIVLQLEDWFGSNPGRGEQNRDVDVTITNATTGTLVWSGRQDGVNIIQDVPGLEKYMITLSVPTEKALEMASFSVLFLHDAVSDWTYTAPGSARTYSFILDTDFIITEMGLPSITKHIRFLNMGEGNITVNKSFAPGSTIEDGIWIGLAPIGAGDSSATKWAPLSGGSAAFTNLDQFLPFAVNPVTGAITSPQPLQYRILEYAPRSTQLQNSQLWDLTPSLIASMANYGLTPRADFRLWASNLSNVTPNAANTTYSILNADPVIDLGIGSEAIVLAAGIVTDGPTYTWTRTKVADPASINIARGAEFEVGYTVTFTRSLQENNQRTFTFKDSNITFYYDELIAESYNHLIGELRLFKDGVGIATQAVNVPLNNGSPGVAGRTLQVAINLSDPNYVVGDESKYTVVFEGRYRYSLTGPDGSFTEVNILTTPTRFDGRPDERPGTVGNPTDANIMNLNDVITAPSYVDIVGLKDGSVTVNGSAATAAMYDIRLIGSRITSSTGMAFPNQNNQVVIRYTVIYRDRDTAPPNTDHYFIDNEATAVTSVRGVAPSGSGSARFRVNFPRFSVINIVKQNQTTNGTLTYGAAGAGIVFAIYNADGTVELARGTTNDLGRVSFNPVPRLQINTQYRIYEINPPAGMAPVGSEWQSDGIGFWRHFRTNANGGIDEVTVRNAFTGSLRVTKVVQGITWPTGTQFEITVTGPNNYRNVFNLTSTSQSRTISNLMPGQYTITERVNAGYSTVIVPNNGTETDVGRVTIPALNTVTVADVTVTNTARHIKVTFDPNLPEPDPTLTGPNPTERFVTFGAQYGALSEVSRFGWTFAGWWTHPTGGTQVQTTTTVTNANDHTLYARWTRTANMWFTVRYQPGSQGIFTEQVYANRLIGTATPLFIGTPEGNPGWRFTGWNPMVADTVTGNATYIAQWERIPGMWFTVRYEPGDEGAFAAVVFENRLINTPTPAFPGTPQGNPGWTFLRWEPAVAASVTGNATYTAIWTRTAGQWFTVSYAPGIHGLFPTDIHTNILTGSATPAFRGDITNAAPGWRFVRWNPTVVNTVTGNATYTAQWERIPGMWFTVRYEPGEHGAFAAQVTQNILTGTATPSFTGTPTGNPGWTFTGWAPIVAATVTSDATYIAQWERTPGQWFTVRYEPGDHGLFPADVHENVLNGSATPAFRGNLENAQPGWKFLRWDPVVVNTVTGNATYVAIWERDADMWFTVRYEPGIQGTFTPQVTQNIFTGTATPAFAGTPTGNDGWTFNGWAPVIESTVTRNMTYVAQWERTSGMWFTVSYEPGDHGLFPADVHNNIQTGSATPAFRGDITNAAPGWRFLRWDPAVSNTVTGNTTYTAMWERIPGMWFTVRYEPGEHGTFAPQEFANVFTGTATPAFDGTPTGSTGWTFTGWAPEVADTVTGDAVYVAQWERIPGMWFTIRYVPGAQGTFTAQETTNILTGTATPAFAGETTGNFGWTFTGWQPAVAHTVTQDMIYVALWARTTGVWFTVSYEPGDHGLFPADVHDNILTGSATPAFRGDITNAEPGWRFVRWNPVVTDTVTGHVTYTAQWERIHEMWFSVRYEPGDQGAFATQEFAHVLTGTTTPAFDGTPTGNNGWAFTGWAPEVADTVTGDAVYVAQWERIPGMWFTVRYEPGTQGTFAIQETTNILTGTATPAFAGETTGSFGWTFAGWAPVIESTVSRNMTYEAQWIRTSGMWFTVTYLPGEQGRFTADTHENILTGSATPEFRGNTADANRGWRFAGWTPAVADTVTGQATYTAQWERIPEMWFTVRYEPGEHGRFTAQEFENRLIDTDTPQFVGTPLGNDGWAFNGWAPIVADTVTGDAVYVAQWERIPGMWFTVRYEPGEHGTFAPQETINHLIDTATPAFLGTTTGSTGWIFAGWSPSPASTVTGDAVYVAQWERIPGMWFTVRYEPGSEGDFAPQETINILRGTATPEFEGEPAGNRGWTFTGWSPAVAGTVTNDAVYVAQWQRTPGMWFTVRYQAGTEGAFAEQVYELRLIDTPTPAFEGMATGNRGWTFIGWEPEVSPFVTGDATYIAQWDRTPGMWFTVSYETGTQGTFIEQTYPNRLVNTATPAFAGEATGKNGWAFKGWAPEIASYVTGNAVYIAQWEVIVFNITYDVGENGGNHPGNPPTFTVEDDTIVLGDPERPGYDFIRWLDEDGNPVTEIPAGSTGDRNFTAEWSDPIEYTITYNLGENGVNHPNNPPTYTIEDDTIILGNPERPGYIFIEWLDENGDPVTGIPAGSIGDREFTAVWSDPIVYNISYVMNGGTNPAANPSTYTVESPTITLLNPTRTGYNFNGWQPANNIPAGSTGDRVFTAIWSGPIVYSITYVMNGGTNHPANPASYTVESPTINLQTPTRPGYTFIWWAPSNSIPAGSTGNRTFTAVWAPSTNITYVVNFFLVNTSTPLLPSVTRTGQTMATNVVEAAPVIAGHTVDASEKGITLGATGNVITFFYSPIILPPPPPVIPPATPPVTPVGGGLTEIEEIVPPLIQEPPMPPTPPPQTSLSPSPEPTTTDDDEHIINIDEIEPPLAGPGGGRYWALLNLIFSVAGALLALVVCVRILIMRREKEEDDENRKVYTSSEEDEEEERKNKRTRLILILLIPVLAIIAIIVFILTQDIRLPIRLSDWWTLLHVILFLGGLISYIFAFRRKKDDEEDDDEQLIGEDPQAFTA